MTEAPTPERQTLMPAGWTRTLLSGAEVALIAWALTLVACVATFAPDSSNRWLAEVSWGYVLSYSAAFFGAGLMGTLPVGSQTVTLMPTLLTLLCVLLGLFSMNLRKHVQVGAYLVFPVGFAVMSTLINLMAATIGSPLRVLGGSFLVALLAACIQILRTVRQFRTDQEKALGTVSDERVSDPLLTWIAQWPRDVFRGLSIARTLIVVMVVYGVLALIASVIFHWHQIAQISQTLGVGGWRLLSLILTQLAYLPTLAWWALTWLAGTGFYVGEGVHFAPGFYTPGPVPAMPLLGAAPVWPADIWPAVWPLFFALSLLGSWRKRRSLRQLRMPLAVSGLLTTAALLLATWLSTGALGAGRLALVGPPLLPSALSLLVQSWGVYAAIQILTSTEAVALVRRALTKLGNGLGRVGGVDPQIPVPAAQSSDSNRRCNLGDNGDEVNGALGKNHEAETELLHAEPTGEGPGDSDN